MNIHYLAVFLSTTILTCFLFSEATSQKIYIDENISYWYNVNNEVHVAHNVYFDGDSAEIFLEITFNQNRNYDDYFFIYELHKSYHTLDVRDTDTLNVIDHILAIKSNKIYVHFKLPNDERTDIALIKIVNMNTGIDYVYDIPFIEDYNFSTDGLILYDEIGEAPHLESFLNVGEAIQVKSIDEIDGPVYVYYYAQNFDEAVPPMIIEDQEAPKELVIDSTFTIPTNQTFNLENEGLYFFQKDSSSANGIGIRVQDQYFPLVKTFDALLDPLIYMSTRTETEAIREASNPKKAFEDYWIQLVKIPSLASSTVKKYYERVEAANYLFTSFEEGWKSDMGLIYIIYGPPNDVYKSEEIIDWVYNRDLKMPVIRFSFYKVKNVFTDHHYTLMRKKNYDKNWFRSVDLWRKGKK